MTFFDNLGKRASEMSARAVQKTKDFSEVARLNSMISDEERKIRDIFLNIGKLYVTKHNDDADDEFKPQISAIVEANSRIASYRQQIQDIRGVIRCEKCGAEIARGVAFCSSCGSPAPKSEYLDIATLNKCEFCGAYIQKDVKFCTSCGREINQEVTETYTESKLGSQILTCPSCGSPVDADALFCIKCGAKMDRSVEPTVADELEKSADV